MMEFRKDLFADERDDNLNEIGKPTARQDILGLQVEFAWGDPVVHGSIMAGTSTFHFSRAEPTRPRAPCDSQHATNSVVMANQRAPRAQRRDARHRAVCRLHRARPGRHALGRRAPDDNRLTTNLPHPPFTFEVPLYAPGTLTAKAYIGNRSVVQTEQKTPGKPTKLILRADESGKELQAGLFERKGAIMPGMW